MYTTYDSILHTLGLKTCGPIKLGFAPSLTLFFKKNKNMKEGNIEEMFLSKVNSSKVENL